MSLPAHVPAYARQPAAATEYAIEEHRVLSELAQEGPKPHTSNARKLAYLMGAVVVGAGALVGGRYAYDCLSPKTPNDNVTPLEFFEFSSPGNYGIRFEDVTVGGGKLKGWLFRSEKPEAPTLVYLHGVRQDAAWQLPNLVRLYQDSGCNVLVLNYRDGKIERTERSLKSAMADIPSAIEEVKKLHPEIVAPNKVFVLGSGLGAQVAVDTAAKMPVAGLILENPRQGVPLKTFRPAFVDHIRSLLPSWTLNMCTSIQPTVHQKLGKIDAPLMVYADEAVASGNASDWFAKAKAADRVLVTPTLLRSRDLAVPSAGTSRESLWRKNIADFVQRISEGEKIGVRTKSLNTPWSQYLQTPEDLLEVAPTVVPAVEEAAQEEEVEQVEPYVCD